MSSRKAFTLIELLVVISIIALLMSILMPALNGAKAQAEVVVCKSNLHQYGIATAGYISDTDRFPHPAFWQSMSPYDAQSPNTDKYGGCIFHNPSRILDGLLIPYLGQDVHHCPTWRKIVRRRGCVWPTLHNPNVPVDPRFNFSMNGYLGFHGAPYPWIPKGSEGDRTQGIMGGFANLPVGGVMRPTEVKRPSETAVFVEENPFIVPGLSNVYVHDNMTWPLIPTRGPGRSAADYVRLYADPSTPKVLPYTGAVATIHGAKGGDLTTGKGDIVLLDGSTAMVDPWEADGYINFWVLWPGMKPTK